MFSRRADRAPRWEVLEDGFDEACYQWQQRETFLRSPELSLAEVAAVHEERLRAYVDVLASTDSGVCERLLHGHLREEDRERVAVAALALLAREEEAGVEVVMELLRTGSTEQRQWVGEVLALSERSNLSAHLQPLLEAEHEPELQAVVLEALVVRGEALGPARVAWALRHSDEAVQCGALLAARRWPREATALQVREVLATSSSATLRALALEVALVQQQREVWRACRKAAEAEDDLGRTARLLLALGGEEEDVALLVELLEEPPLRRDTLWALGFSGRRLAAEACLRWLEDEALGRLAAESFSAMTGLKLEEPYGRPATLEEELPPLEEDLNTPLLPGPDDDLPVPDTARLERWWDQASQGFEPRTRYLGGKPLTAQRLVEALEELPMRRRPPLALELAIRTGGEHVVETRAFARVQRRQLASARTWQGGPCMSPFTHWMSR